MIISVSDVSVVVLTIGLTLVSFFRLLIKYIDKLCDDDSAILNDQHIKEA